MLSGSLQVLCSYHNLLDDVKYCIPLQEGNAYVTLSNLTIHRSVLWSDVMEVQQVIWATMDGKAAYEFFH